MNIEILKRILIDAVDENDRQLFFKGELTFARKMEILSEGIRDSYVCDGRVRPPRAETMIGMPRLNNFQYCIEQAIVNNIEGDIIETGVWRGGACILAAAVTQFHHSNKKIFVADSFEGLPEPEEKYHADKNDEHYKMEFLKVAINKVKSNFKKYGLLNHNVVFIKGFFKDSLKTPEIKKLSVLRLDGDMYSSTWEVLTLLYKKLSVGGYLIIDDYALPACKKAVDDFRQKNNITDEIITVDWTGIYWQKTKN